MLDGLMLNDESGQTPSSDLTRSWFHREVLKRLNQLSRDVSPRLRTLLLLELRHLLQDASRSLSTGAVQHIRSLIESNGYTISAGDSSLQKSSPPLK